MAEKDWVAEEGSATRRRPKFSSETSLCGLASLNVCAPPHAYVETLIPKWLYLEAGCLGGNYGQTRS